MLINKQATEPNNESKTAERQLGKEASKAAIQDDWDTVKTWAASFGVRLLIAGGVIFFFVVLPVVILGGQP